jgi:NAD(P)-dependent dehydrogenase (short-subunit alcohol dehydrogenase family)
VKSGSARIVNVASEASRNHGVLKLPSDLTDTTPFSALGSSRVYGKSKLLDIMFSVELARRYAGTGTVVTAIDPGFNVTGLGRELGFSTALGKILGWLHIGDPNRGAEILVRMTSVANPGATSGLYFTVKDKRPIEPVSPGNDIGMQKSLWNETEKLLGDYL